MDEQTRANLLQAMHEEAFARAKFLLFAVNAEAAGQAEAARLLDRSAGAQGDHFERMADLYELSRTVADDLGDAIATEVRTDYQGLAAQAHRVGEIEAAHLFEAIHSFKAAQREALGSAALRLKLDSAREPQQAERREYSVAIAPEQVAAERAGMDERPEPEDDVPVVDTPEYRTVHLRKSLRRSAGGAVELERRLNELAEDGWTLVEAIGSQLILSRRAGPARHSHGSAPSGG